MECGDKSPLSKAVPRHRTPKDGVFRGGSGRLSEGEASPDRGKGKSKPQR